MPYLTLHRRCVDELCIGFEFESMIQPSFNHRLERSLYTQISATGLDILQHIPEPMPCPRKMLLSLLGCQRGVFDDWHGSSFYRRHHFDVGSCECSGVCLTKQLERKCANVPWDLLHEPIHVRLLVLHEVDVEGDGAEGERESVGCASFFRGSLGMMYSDLLSSYFLSM